MKYYLIHYRENNADLWEIVEGTNEAQAVQDLNEAWPIPAEPLEIVRVRCFDTFTCAIRARDHAERDHARKTLIDRHNIQASTGGRPSNTVADVVRILGREKAREIVALCVIAKGDWDGRISDRNREWAAVVSDETRRTLDDAGFYYPDAIHPAHLDMLADAMRNYQAPAQEEPADLDAVSERVHAATLASLANAGMLAQEEQPAALVDLDELAADLNTGDRGDALNDYRDSSAYICDAISEAADNRVGIYYHELLAFISDNPEALADVVAEGLYDPAHNYNLWDHARAAQFLVIERDIYDHMADALMLAAVDFIRYDLKRHEIPAELAELLREWCDEADNNDRMSDIPDRIREYFDALEGGCEA